MRPVLAEALESGEGVNGVELIVAVGVEDPVEATAAVVHSLFAIDDHVEAVESPQQSMGMPDGDVELLDPRRRRIATQRRRFDTIEGAVLVGSQQPPLRIHRQGNPGATVIGCRVIQDFCLESLRDRQFRGVVVHGKGNCVKSQAHKEAQTHQERKQQVTHQAGLVWSNTNAPYTTLRYSNSPQHPLSRHPECSEGPLLIVLQAFKQRFFAALRMTVFWVCCISMAFLAK